jgi:hypothetical protein
MSVVSIGKHAAMTYRFLIVPIGEIQVISKELSKAVRLFGIAYGYYQDGWIMAKWNVPFFPECPCHSKH